ncbi:MAG: hypothetical protein ABWX70_12130, partial [Hyphomicrobium sp.]
MCRSGCRWRPVGGKGSFAAGGAELHRASPRPCPLCSSRRPEDVPPIMRGVKLRNDHRRSEKAMKREEIEKLREAVRCAVLLEQAGFGVVGWMGRAGTRVPEWRGFSTGGSKVLFRLGAPDALRLCVTEAAIDAMSLAAIEGLQDDT